MKNNYNLYIPQKINDVVLIVHGMEETQERYKDFSLFLKDNNCIVLTYNLIGHEENNRGYFGIDGKNKLVKQLENYVNFLYDKYNIKVTIIGHSMGSLIVRNYLQLNSQKINKIILLGTPPPRIFTNLAKFIAKIITKFKNDNEYSLLLEKLTFLNTYKFPDLSWISLNEENVNFYKNSPDCGFKFTINGYITLYQLVIDLNKTFLNQNKNIPISIFVGSDDPIVGGQYGLKKTINNLKKQGFNNINIKIYNKLRHELLNELNKKEIYDDILKRIKEHNG